MYWQIQIQSTMKTILLMVICCLFDLYATAQLLDVRQYGIAEGMPQANGNHMVQDKNGYIWVATQSGIARFDGKHFKTYTQRDGLISNLTTRLLIDSKDNLWIGTRNGLSYFNGSKFENLQPLTKDGFAVEALCEDNKGNLWIGTERGLFLLTKGNLQSVNLDERLFQVYSICEDDEGVIWVGTAQGIYQIVNQSIAQPVLLKGLNGSRISAIARDRNGQIWVATLNGLYRFSKTQRDVVDFSVEVPIKEIKALLPDDEGNIWIGSETEGLAFFDGNDFTTYKDENGVVSASLLSLMKDREENIWIGTRNGILRLNPKNPFLHYTSASGLTHDIFGITQDPVNQKFWLASYGHGLYEFDGKKFKNYNFQKGLKDNCHFTIIPDRKGRMWLASARNGVFYTNNGKFEQLVPDTVLPNERIFGILEDSRGRLWFATRTHGAAMWDGKNIRYWNPSNSTLSGSVIALAEIPGSGIWTGNIDGGVSVIADDKAYRLFSQDDSLAKIMTRAIAYTDNKTIWLGTAGAGLVKILLQPDGSFKRHYYNQSDGLNSGNIYQMKLDSKGRLWVGTEMGINRISFNNEHEIAEIRSYGRKEGFIGTETNLNGIWEDNHGRLWFSTQMGITSYQPAKDKPINYQPRVHIHNIHIFYKSVNWKDYADSVNTAGLPLNLVLNHNDNHLSFGFHAIYFTNPDMVSYQYMLEGIDKDWSPATTITEVHYPNLPPNNYRFLVRASIDGKNWTSQPAAFSFRIKPPFWQTPLAYGLFITVLSGIVYTFYRWRVRQLKQRQNELAEEVRQRTIEINRQTDEIRQQHDRLLEQNKELMKAKQMIDRQRETLETEVESRTKELVHSMHQLERFAFMIAHNLRGPAARVLGLGAVLELMPLKTVSTEEADIICKLIHATHELDTVIRDMGQIIDINNNRNHILTKVVLAEEMEKVQIQLAGEIERLQAIIKTDFTDAPAVFAYEPYVFSVLYQLVSNSLKFRQLQSRPIVEVKSYTNGKYTRIEVKDNGLGIDLASYGEKIFSLYARFHLHVEGKGMGLCLVKTQVTALGGKIDVSSRVGEGTTFTIDLKPWKQQQTP
jgi:ligand-binding sensor domain-containing protein/signal transduction histidine kinase